METIEISEEENIPSNVQNDSFYDDNDDNEVKESSEHLSDDELKQVTASTTKNKSIDTAEEENVPSNQRKESSTDDNVDNEEKESCHNLSDDDMMATNSIFTTEPQSIPKLHRLESDHILQAQQHEYKSSSDEEVTQPKKRKGATKDSKSKKKRKGKNEKKTVPDIIVYKDNKSKKDNCKIMKFLESPWLDKSKKYKEELLEKAFCKQPYAYQPKVVKDLRDDSDVRTFPCPHKSCFCLMITNSKNI